ncbi:MAG: tetratricopeptide repeat protein [Sphingobium sp.]|uniref:tetratricopeptide repeat protein n=1 Tax=Sphingobium sp. TaxID=1912891 RepID=UPI0029B3C13C|nr:tetratricopeptide repeat protein [Sphingobium sp.]MDX3910971.1 tetratricopeptide repeat protein [Sphingobium sp.]
MVKRSFVTMGAALLAMGISASASAGTQTEVGYAPGALGVSAILSGNYDAAAERLNSLEGTTKRDPARLINLGNAYAGMGRTADADRAYRKAMKAMPVDLLLADGSVASSRDIAREALSRLPRMTYASR